MERFLQIVGGLVTVVFITSLILLGWFCMSGTGQKVDGIISWLLTYGIMWLTYGIGIFVFTVVQAGLLTAYTKPRFKNMIALSVYAVFGFLLALPMPALIFSFNLTATTVLAVVLLVASLVVVGGYTWFIYVEHEHPTLTHKEEVEK